MACGRDVEGELLRELGVCQWGVWSREEPGLAPPGSGMRTRWDGGAFSRAGDHGKRTVLRGNPEFSLDVQAQTYWHADIQRPGTQLLNQCN